METSELTLRYDYTNVLLLKLKYKLIDLHNLDSKIVRISTIKYSSKERLSAKRY